MNLAGGEVEINEIVIWTAAQDFSRREPKDASRRIVMITEHEKHLQ